MLAHHYKRVFWVVLLIVLAIAFYTYSSRQKPVNIQVSKVTIGVIEDTVANTRAGTVKACRRAQLAPATGGQIDSLPVREGDLVKQGAILLALWNDDLQAQVKLARSESDAAVDHAESICVQAENAQRAANRKQALRQTRVVSEEDLERAVALAKSQAADCKAARTSARVSAERVGVILAQLERTQLRAPFDGVVVEVNGEVGEYVTPSPPGIPSLPAVDLVDRSCFYVQAPIDEVDVSRITEKMSARISLDAFRGRVFPATVSRIADYVLDREKQARTVDIEVRFDNNEDVKQMLPGYSADAEVIISSRDDVLRIPTEALLEQHRVYVFNENSSLLEMREVEIGLSNWQYTEIIKGLQAGEQLVLTPDRLGVEDGAFAQVEKGE
ncbi:MAG: efflux RND transporter periplasmic adaptor subunit [Gammaproteobacteria bacterium]